jgi:hypothetical protein
MGFDWASIGTFLISGAILVGSASALIGTTLIIHGALSFAASKSVTLARSLSGVQTSEEIVAGQLVTDAREVYRAAWPQDFPKVEVTWSRPSRRWVIATQRSVRLVSDRRLEKEVLLTIHDVQAD